MLCYHPITGYRSLEGRNPNTGGWPVVFNPKYGYHDMPVTMPCGQCIGCRLEKSRQWAVRAMFESEQYEQNCFITLTFDNEHLKTVDHQSKKTIQKFLKRLRKQINHEHKKAIRYFGCFEYGDRYGRPHYHMCIFGHDFTTDRVPIAQSKSSFTLYQSPSLSKSWPYGLHRIGDLTFESAAYVARYITKKITGPAAEGAYDGRMPEYAIMSRKPGLGKEWYEKYKEDIFAVDKVIVRNNLQVTPPTYYNNCMKNDDLPRYEKLKQKRKEYLTKNAHNLTPERLRVKEILKQLTFKKLVRSYEHEVDHLYNP